MSTIPVRYDLGLLRTANHHIVRRGGPDMGHPSCADDDAHALKGRAAVLHDYRSSRLPQHRLALRRP
jgi:hypothetical protein